MSEDITQELGELAATETPEAGSDPASTTVTGEESTVLDLESEKHTAAEQKEKQIAAYQKKLDAGEIALDQIPAKLKWVREELEKRQAKSQKEEAKAQELDVDAIVERKLAEKQEDQQFNTLKSDLESQDLTSEERSTLTAEYKDLRKAGLGKLKALEKAKKLAGIGTNVARPSAPSSFRQVREEQKADSIEAIMKLPEEKRIAALKALTL